MTIEGAIAELQNLINADDVPFYYDGVIKKVIETIIDECKPKVGKWIEHPNHIECPNCKVWFLKKYMPRNSYCPNCGTKMEGRKE